MKLLGIDYGTKRVGIALSDDEGHLAFPYGVLLQDKKLVQEIKVICEKEKVNTIIIGESLDFNQIENPIMHAVHELKKALEEKTGLPVLLESELFTTQEARRPPERIEKTRRRQRFLEEGSRKPYKREVVDSSAAAIILQGYIDRTKKDCL